MFWQSPPVKKMYLLLSPYIWLTFVGDYNNIKLYGLSQLGWSPLNMCVNYDERIELWTVMYTYLYHLLVHSFYHWTVMYTYLDHLLVHSFYQWTVIHLFRPLIGTFVLSVNCYVHLYRPLLVHSFYQWTVMYTYIDHLLVHSFYHWTVMYTYIDHLTLL